MATPLNWDSELSDAHLESLERREESGECHEGPKIRVSVVRLHKRRYLVNIGQDSMLFILLSSKRR
jgi:hypothetical protein